MYETCPQFIMFRECAEVRKVSYDTKQAKEGVKEKVTRGSGECLEIREDQDFVYYSCITTQLLLEGHQRSIFLQGQYNI